MGSFGRRRWPARAGPLVLEFGSQVAFKRTKLVPATMDELEARSTCVSACHARGVWYLFVYAMRKTWYQYIARAASAHIVEGTSGGSQQSTVSLF